MQEVADGCDTCEGLAQAWHMHLHLTNRAMGPTLEALPALDFLLEPL